MSLGGQSSKANVMPASALWPGLWVALKGALSKIRVQKKHRSLRVRETLALGDRRFLAVVQFENQTLLVGVTPQNITLLEARSLNNDTPPATFRLQEEDSA